MLRAAASLHVSSACAHVPPLKQTAIGARPVADWAPVAGDSSHRLAILMPCLPGEALWKATQHAAPTEQTVHALLSPASNIASHVPLCPTMKGSVDTNAFVAVAAAGAAVTAALQTWQPDPVQLKTSVAGGTAAKPLGFATPTAAGVERFLRGIRSDDCELPPLPRWTQGLPCAADPCTQCPTSSSPTLVAKEWNLSCPGATEEALRPLEELAASHESLGGFLSALRAGMFLWRAVALPVVHASCPPGWIHGDLNDLNILVKRGTNMAWEVSGIIDFDDMSRGFLIYDLAILATYACMQAPDPCAVLSALVCGWHSRLPLTPAEISVLPSLMAARCTQSLVAAARRCSGAGAAASYASIHAQPALALLHFLLSQPIFPPGTHIEGLADHSGSGLVQHLLALCGFLPEQGQAGIDTSSETTLQQLLPGGDLGRYSLPSLAAARDWSRGELGEEPVTVWASPPPPAYLLPPLAAGPCEPCAASPLLPHVLGTPGVVSVFDFSAGGGELVSSSGFEAARMAAFSKSAFRQMVEAGAAVGWGKYGEDRAIYQSEHFKAGSAAASARTLHLGVDLMVPAHTPLFAPAAGSVHSFAVNTNALDYGPALILRHGDDQQAWFSLYGHCSPRTYQLWQHRAHAGGASMSPADSTGHVLSTSQGFAVEAGDLIGWVGEAPTNGGWPPHLHFQIMTVDPWTHSGSAGDFAGVCPTADWEKTWGEWVPSPAPVLGWSPDQAAGSHDGRDKS